MLTIYQKVPDLFRAVSDRLGKANTLLALAPFSENAEEVFGIAISLCEAIGDQFSVRRGLYYYGLWLRDQGHHQKAHSCLMRSLEAFEQLGLPQIAATVQQALQTL